MSGWIRSALAVVVLSSIIGAAGPALGQEKAPTLGDARKGFETKLLRKASDGTPLVDPPRELFVRMTYPGPLGPMSAYLGRPPSGGGKHPAMVWITGGFPPGGTGEHAWEPVSARNDQSARAFREAGMILMFPTFRGSYGNPGFQESFYGEVDEVVAAAEYLAKLDFVDPARIYLGGHSTGGTLALLAAAATERFRGVFAFGPVEDPSRYSPEVLTYDATNAKEHELRAPIRYLDGIKSPTWVLEGSRGGNVESIVNMAKASKNDRLTFAVVKGADHFDVLAPVTRLIAQRIMECADKAPLRLPAQDMQTAFDYFQRSLREADDLEILSTLRRNGADLEAATTVEHFLLAREPENLVKAKQAAAGKGFQVGDVQSHHDREGRPYFALGLRRKLVLGDLKAVFAASQVAYQLSLEHGVDYDGWNVP